VEQRFRFVSPGAIGGVALWVVFAIIFSLYVNHFGTYNKVYGTLAGLAILLLFMYYSAFILLVGAEVNQVIEEHAPGGKDEGQRRFPDTGEKRRGQHDIQGLVKETRPRSNAG
jgi:membrane protein